MQETTTAESEATTLWLADGVALAATEAVKVLEQWMAYDPADESSQVYGYTVDRLAAYHALAEVIQRGAFNHATAGLNRFKGDRAAEKADDDLTNVVEAVVRKHIGDSDS